MYPENPSERIHTFYKCSYCNKLFVIRDEFLDHLEKYQHRICIVCGQFCGGIKEFIEGKFVAERLMEGNVETYRYKHTVCPSFNPTKRLMLDVENRKV